LIGALIVTHGRLAHELLNAAQQIEANTVGIEAVALDWNESVETAREKIRQAMDRIGPDRGVIIFTDMFGGTPSNISLSFLDHGRVEIITGVNLPMVIKLATVTAEDSLAEIARKICDQGRQGIYLAGALLAQPPTKTGAD